MFTPVFILVLVGGLLTVGASAMIHRAMERDDAFVSARAALGAAGHEMA
jgi:hypothetical protein